MDATVAARARAFAHARARCLESIYRVAKAEDGAKTLWLDGRAFTPATSLSARERDDLGAALDELHACGLVHGAVDEYHVVRDDGVLVLRFSAQQSRASSVDDDRRALATFACA